MHVAGVSMMCDRCREGYLWRHKTERIYLLYSTDCFLDRDNKWHFFFRHMTQRWHFHFSDLIFISQKCAFKFNRCLTRVKGHGPSRCASVVLLCDLHAVWTEAWLLLPQLLQESRAGSDVAVQSHDALCQPQARGTRHSAFMEPHVWEHFCHQSCQNSVFCGRVLQ